MHFVVSVPSDGVSERVCHLCCGAVGTEDGLPEPLALLLGSVSAWGTPQPELSRKGATWREVAVVDNPAGRGVATVLRRSTSLWVELARPDC